MPSANRPSSDIKTRANVRAHVSRSSVSSPPSESATLNPRLQSPALAASARVMIRTIRSTAIKTPEKGLDAERVSVLATHYNARGLDSGDPNTYADGRVFVEWEHRWGCNWRLLSAPEWWRQRLRPPSGASCRVGSRSDSGSR